MPYPSTVAQIEARLVALAGNSSFSGFCQRFTLPANPTHDGRVVSYLRIGTGTGGGRPRILIVSGVHARELAPPDAVLTFVEKLLTAYAGTTAMAYARFDDPRQTPRTRYKPFTIPYPGVQRIVERTELYVLPLANPDGRAFVQAVNDPRHKGWRKNRRPAPPGVTCSPGNQGPEGVDINRNFDVGWDFRKYYSAAAIAAMTAPGAAATLGVSDDPCKETFHGPAPPSSGTRVREPETLNLVSVLNDKDVNFYLDVHSFSAAIIFPWGLEQNQEAHPEQTFNNHALDAPAAGRDALGSAYAEWMPPGTEARHQMLANTMRDAILDSTGYSALDATGSGATPPDPMAGAARTASTYAAVQSPCLFGAGFPPDFEPGGADDFAFSRQIGATAPPVRATALAPVFSLTFECGRTDDGGFRPDATREYPKVEREVGAGIAAYLSFAATWHAPVPPATTPTTPPPSTSSSWCFIATAAYGSPLHPKVRYLCDVRDRDVKTTRFGKWFMARVDRVYYSFSPQVAGWLRRHGRSRTAVRIAIAEPWIAIVRVSVGLTRWIRAAELRAAGFLGLVTVGTLGAIGAIGFLLYVVGRLLAGVA
jgi:hypothetical protein